MILFPKASGIRPRLACELLPGGVVAGRSPEPGLPLAAVARVEVPESAMMPGLKPGNVVDRVAIIAAVRRALEGVGGRSNGRNAELTLIIPDAAVRVLLLDFDALPAKLSEALPIVRFRLKKLVPFDTDAAMVSYQVMSTSRSLVRVLAVAMPRDVLAEYETVAREAGFEPGAVLPSTLAALAGLAEGDRASLVVNAHATGVTTAIVREGMLLLHRSVELAELGPGTPANFPPTLFEVPPGSGSTVLPLVDRDATEAEWAAQEPVPEFGRNPYADRIVTEVPTQNQDANAGLQATPTSLLQGQPTAARSASLYSNGRVDMYAEGAAPVSRSPYAAMTLGEDLDEAFPAAPVFGSSAAETFAGAPDYSGNELDQLAALAAEPDTPVHTLAPDAQAEEIARAVSVAVAFFEDTLSSAPEMLFSAGPLGASGLSRLLQEQGLPIGEGVTVREMVEPAILAPTAVSAQVPRSWLAGIAGALRS